MLQKTASLIPFAPIPPRDESAAWCCPHCGRAMKGAPRLAEILKEIAQLYRVTEASIISEDRRGPIIRARLAFYVAAASRSRASYAQIGRFCGSRDHQTILSGIKRYCARTGTPMPREKFTWRSSK